MDQRRKMRKRNSYSRKERKARRIRPDVLRRRPHEGRPESDRAHRSSFRPAIPSRTPSSTVWRGSWGQKRTPCCRISPLITKTLRMWSFPRISSRRKASTICAGRARSSVPAKARLSVPDEPRRFPVPKRYPRKRSSARAAERSQKSQLWTPSQCSKVRSAPFSARAFARRAFPGYRSSCSPHVI